MRSRVPRFSTRFGYGNASVTVFRTLLCARRARLFFSALATLPILGLAGQLYAAEPDTTLYVFTDTTSARIELTIPNTRQSNREVIQGTIRSATDSTVLWSGTLGSIAVGADRVARLEGKASGLRPRLWSPQSPSLYYLTVSGVEDGTRFERTVRFGFRSMASRNGQILLNGRPIFLRGNAINPPGRNIPDSLEENRRFVEPYIRYLKSVGVNIIRLTRHSQVWFDVCDELGMMLFQGNYGTPRDGKPTQAPTVPFQQSLEWYKHEVIGPLVNHPSVVVYVLTNEQADAEIPYLNTGAEGIDRFLRLAYDSLHAWDSTRAYIANAGYGFGRAGDICDLHRYWGWYYNSFLSFYTMRDPKVCWRSSKIQPMTMTENVGNYTSVDGRYNLVSNTKQPDSQLNWTGHAPQSEQAGRALAYQAWMAGQAIEIYRRSRQQNPNLAGITPFSIIFHNWWGISGFSDMKPKPIARQYAVSYQPVLLSWELWTPQVYSGSTIQPVAHVVNDSDNGENLDRLVLHYRLSDSRSVVRLEGRSELPATPYYAARSKRVTVQLPVTLPAGDYVLSGMILRGGDTLSRNQTKMFVAAPSFVGKTTGLSRRVVVYDSSGLSVRALRRIGIAATVISSVNGLSAGRDLLIVGADSWTASLGRDTQRLRAFVAAGGRMIILHQDPARFDGRWLPSPVRIQKGELDHSQVFPGGRPFRNGMAVNPERSGHPVLDGINRERLFLWSDFTNWDESKPGFPQVYPVTRGFVLTDPRTLDRAAVIANYDHGLEGIAIAELFEGSGSVMMTGLDLVNRSGIDPVADRLLANLIRYMGGVIPHINALAFDSRITWGDYASERGLLTGIYSGLILNTVPVVPAGLKEKYPVTVDRNGFTYAGGPGGWNTKPSVQYVGRGRRPFGPYGFTSGGSVTLPEGHAALGQGRVWLRIPAARRTMVTTVSNPAAEPLPFEIEVNGERQHSVLPPNGTTRIETSVKGGETPLAIVFRGDRRAVILETDFR